MFGTLVIQLPSNYIGGQLTVNHRSKNTEYDFGGSAGCANFYYAAFYADCQHEIKPVTKGYRLCLIYNLVYQGSDNCPAPANNQQSISTIVSSMREWSEDVTSADQHPMIAYLLEHKYCEASLSFQLLKNTDRAVADVLTQAKMEVDFDLYVANVSLVENWSATHYGYDDYAADDLVDESVSANNLKSRDGKTITSIDLQKECFVPEDFFDTIDPDEEEFEEATGNEGATLDKQYNWAALLLWPSKNRTTNIGITNMIHLLKKDLLDPTFSQDKKTALEAVAKDIVSACASHSDDGYFTTEAYMSLLQSLQSLGNVELISDFLQVIASSMSDHYFIESPSFSQEVLAIGCKYGWNTLRSSLQTIFDKLSSSKHRIEKYFLFLREISQQPSSSQKDVCRGLASAIVSVLSSEDDTKPPSTQPTYSYLFYGNVGNTRGKEFAVHLIKCLMTLECNEQLLSLVQAFRTKPNRYPILTILAPVCEELFKSLKEGEGENIAFQQLLSFCISSLEASSNQAISLPTNWSEPAEPVTFSCSCADCVTLMRFLRHPTETQQRFKMGKARRFHLHRQLDSNVCSATHVTEHVGNPHTLVVTKTRTNYNKDCKKLQNEKATLSRLRALIGAPPAKRQKLNGSGSASSVSGTDPSL